MTSTARGFRGFRLAHRTAILHDSRVNLSRLTCRASLADDGSGPLCGGRAMWLMTAACEHEHMVPSLGCDAHAEDVRRRKLTCTECRTGGEPHRCPVTVEFVALTPEGTRS